jgi:hypothetical protein
MGGVPILPDFLVFLLLARANAFSKFFYRFQRESAVYHAVPLRGCPLARGMLRSKAPCLLCKGSGFGSANFECITNPPRWLIKTKVITLAIKAVVLMHLSPVLLARVRGLIVGVRCLGSLPFIYGKEMGAGGQHLWHRSTLIHVSFPLHVAPHLGQ